jgi:hypothetical protein
VEAKKIFANVDLLEERKEIEEVANRSVHGTFEGRYREKYMLGV